MHFRAAPFASSLWPGFTREAAAAKLGTRVRFARDAGGEKLARCPSVSNRVEFVGPGDRETVVGVAPWAEGVSRNARACRVMTQWDHCEEGERCSSPVDRRTYERMLSEE